MEDLIKALQILAKYTDKKYPTYCNDETLVVLVNPEKVSLLDIEELKKLGFEANIENSENFDSNWGECFYSFRFGNC